MQKRGKPGSSFVPVELTVVATLETHMVRGFPTSAGCLGSGFVLALWPDQAKCRPDVDETVDSNVHSSCAAACIDFATRSRAISPAHCQEVSPWLLRRPSSGRQADTCLKHCFCEQQRLRAACSCPSIDVWGLLLGQLRGAAAVFLERLTAACWTLSDDLRSIRLSRIVGFLCNICHLCILC